MQHCFGLYFQFNKMERWWSIQTWNTIYIQ
jgi:hypothetical protein